MIGSQKIGTKLFNNSGIVWCIVYIIVVLINVIIIRNNYYGASLQFHAVSRVTGKLKELQVIVTALCSFVNNTRGNCTLVLDYNILMCMLVYNI